ncbi:uncharacterized protein LOC130625676 [Hydractinia symbiolongicarpus]|uniref:uncharacterized protein LOC130625676 n=1 Tax=Hydractinia symbiolongicarpus TaxID=13093 RepID=UPI002550D711|nr:uncharacterized protein LOC130625676 [Hydractinia symbiolongicarpus]
MTEKRKENIEYGFQNGKPELEIKCFNGKVFSEFQKAANFFFNSTFTGWMEGDSTTYLIPPLFRCKSEGFLESGLNSANGMVGNIIGDQNEFSLYRALEKNQSTGPQIVFHSFRLRERLKTYNKLMLASYHGMKNPFEIHAKKILRQIDENTRREDAECDFVMFDKEHGVFLFEVKSSVKARNDAKQQLEVDSMFMKVLIENGLAEAGFVNAWELSENIPIHTYAVYPSVHRPSGFEDMEIFKDDIKSLDKWWKRNVKDVKKRRSKADEIIELMTILAARFVAMASTSPITINEAIANLGDTLTLQTFGKSKKFKFMFFTPNQDEILHHGPEKLILQGPPGCGKTIIMMYKSLELAKIKQQEINNNHCLSSSVQISNTPNGISLKKILVICGYKAYGLKCMYKDFLKENLGSNYTALVDVLTKQELDSKYGSPLLLIEKDNICSHYYCDVFIDELQSVMENLIKCSPSLEEKLFNFIDLLPKTFHFVWLSIDPSQSTVQAILPPKYNDTLWDVSKLSRTLRNTENIVKEVRHFAISGYDVTPGHRIQGTATEWIDVDIENEELTHQHLIEVIQHLTEQKRRTLKVINSSNMAEIVNPGNLEHKDILVYWNKKETRNLQQLIFAMESASIPVHMLSPSYSRNVNKVTVAIDAEEILSMEFRVVIAMYVNYGEEYAEKSLIVPVSRAMCHLIMFRNISV